jgi:hypothetical protein
MEGDMPTYVYCSLFVDAVNALVTGDTDRIDRLECELATSDQPPLMVGIWTTLSTLRDAGIATMSDNGWWTFRHPQIGALCWKTTMADCERPGRCLFLGADGKIVVEIWPRSGPTSRLWSTPKRSPM